MTTPAWSGRRVQQARAYMAPRLPATCGQCGGLVTADDEWIVGHIKSRHAYPELTWTTSNWRIEHKGCSDGSGHGAIVEKALRTLTENGIDTSDFSPETSGSEAQHLPVSLPAVPEEPFSIPEGLTWPHFVQQAPEWLLPWLEPDENSNPPLAVSPLHPDAVGTHAVQAIPWIEAVEGKTLRWWQRLGLVLKLQHNEAGELLKREVTETGPRRAGKSVGLRGLALWRMEHGTALFGERQEIIHTGSDMSVCRKAQKEAWRWAEGKWGPKAVTRGNGKEAIERPDDGSVWYVRAQDATYGWDTTLALVDESWDVKPDTITEGIDPSLMGRKSPQKVQTSTSHRRARSTMRTALATGLSSDDPRLLVLWWGALPTDDPGDPETWRKASPYWDEDRHEFVASMYAKALAGQEDPELDDPDPMRGFACQFLNLWNLKERRAPKGEPLTEADAWAALEVPVGELRVPDAMAVETWFDGGVSVAKVFRADDYVVVDVVDFDNLASAAAAVRASGFRGRAVVGASIADDPAFTGVRTIPGKGQVGAVVREFGLLLASGVVRHSGGAHLAEQVLEVRTIRGADGPRVVSNGRADAVKAALWAIREARKPSVGKPRILTA